VLTDTAFAQWNEQISLAYDRLGSPQFAPDLIDAIDAVIDFDICMVFSYSHIHGAHTLHHNMSAEVAKIVADDYVAGPYLLDPFFNAVRRGKRSGFASMRELAPDRFYHSEFYRHHYVRTGIADEIGIFFDLSDDTTAVLSITRQDKKHVFTHAERQMFSGTSAVIEHLGKKQWSHAKHKEIEGPKQNRLDAAFDSFAQDDLTMREREVVTLVLRGHSSMSIGYVLNISTGTVKIHRKNAYEKLNISSQAELFSAFISYLEKDHFV